MGFGIVEDRPTPPEVYNWRIYTLAIVASFGALTFGYDGSFFGTTLARASFQEHFGFKDMSASARTSNTSNITSSYLAAGFFGSLFAWPSSETLGRIRAMQVSCAMFLVGAVLMTATTSSLPMMYSGRVLTGFGVGALTGIIPSYIAEVAPTAIRGQLTGYFDVAYQVGSLVGFWINYGINQNMGVDAAITFRIPLAIQIIPGGLLALGTLILRESPTLLWRKGKREQAIKNLCYLRQLPADHQYMLEEVGRIEARLEEEERLSGGQTGWLAILRGSMTEMKTPSIRFRLAVIVGMFMFQNWSGSICINYYSPILFRSLLISDVALYTGIYGVCRSTAAIAFYAFIVDRTGRRLPWLISASACSLTLLYIAIFTTVADTTVGAPSASVHAVGTGATAMVMLYGIFWSFGGNGLPWIVAAEIFPARLRPITGAFAASLQWFFSFILTLVFPYMIASDVGANGTFFFFSALCFLTAVFTFVWVPETKAVPIECCEALFSGKMRHAAWRAEKLFPPNGIPPVPDHIAAGEAAYIQAHLPSSPSYDYKTKNEREEIESV
ncbi:putative quinate permease [Alternaria gaisen]|uniref:Quinate permease n=1 Tax=Alternaria gaisen TaxID=167740 RepID=A0ACB6FWB4_9PLEO|nr:putative quinate permease [Alternaria gaisen]